MSSSNDNTTADYDRHYLDCYSSTYVVRLLGFHLRDAQDAMQCADIDEYPASVVLLRLAAHFVLKYRSR